MHPHLHTEETQKSTKPPSYSDSLLFRTHLLTPPLTDCADVVAALEECHARGFLWKVTGNCTEAKYHVTMCLRAQRLERTRKNREEAKEKREKIEKVWAELDANK